MDKTLEILCKRKLHHGYTGRSWPMDERLWIAPALPAAPRFELYKANRDPAMEAIREYVKAASTGSHSDS